MNKSTSIYIHIPYCVSKCKYCDFFSVENHKTFVPQEYVEALCNEIKYRKKQFNVSVLKTVYIGGGTPSLLTETQLSEICNVLFEGVVLSSDFEFTVEVNPDDVSEQLLLMFEKNKINRISCGIQSLNDECLRFSGRRASLKENLKALEIFRKFWKKDLSLDLICGLPGETEESFLEGLKKICSYSPSHISMYSLTIEENTVFGKLWEKGELHYDFDKADELWLEGRKFLMESEYTHYEVSNFCKTGKECRHNLVYWNHQDYIGTGSGGTGTVYFDNGTGDRWTNVNNLTEYINFWKNSIFSDVLPQTGEKIDLDTSKFEFFMMGLRKISGISEKQYEELFGEKIPEKIKDCFCKWQKYDRAKITKYEEDTVFTLGKDGVLFLNAFLEEII